MRISRSPTPASVVRRAVARRAIARAALPAALAVSVAVTVAGCQPLHFSHPGRTAACAVALPQALNAVGGRGRLVGFRVVKGRALHGLFVALAPPLGPRAQAAQAAQARRRRLLRERNSPPAPAGEPRAKVCMVVYTGAYGPGSVASAPPGDRGRYAVLVIFVRHAAIVRARLLDTLPPAVKRLL